MQINCLVGIAVTGLSVFGDHECINLKNTHISFRSEPDFTGRILKQNYTEVADIVSLIDEKGPINLILSRDRWDSAGISTTASLEVFSWNDAPETFDCSFFLEKHNEQICDEDDPNLLDTYLKYASDNDYVFAYYYNVGIGWSCFRTLPAPENYDYSGREVTIPDGDYTSLIDMPSPPRYEDLPEV